MTRKAFAKGITLLGLTYPERFGELSKDHLRAWFTLLSDLTNQEWERAILYVCRNEEKSPTPATIRRIALESNTLTAEEAWSQVKAAVASVGRYEFPRFEDQAVTRAVQALGWSEICDARVDDLAGLRAHFFRTFQAMHKREQFQLEDARVKALVSDGFRLIDGTGNEAEELRRGESIIRNRQAHAREEEETGRP
jgi:hypothetical protein